MPSPQRPSTSLIQRLGLDRYSAAYLMVVFFAYFAITKGSVYTDWNASIKQVLEGKVIVGVLALAFLVPLTCQNFDLSVGHTMGFSIVITTALAKNTDLPQGVAALIAMACCALVGFVSGFIVVKLNVNSFIATLGISQVLTALSIIISGNRNISNVLSETYKNFGRKPIGFGDIKLPLFFWYMIVLAIVLWYVLEHTPLGRKLFAVGGNLEAARLAGLNTGRIVWGSLLASSLIAGFAGLVHTWKVGTYESTIGPANLFAAVAAVFFGASQLRNRPNVWGALLAMYALAMGVQGLRLTFLKGVNWIEKLFEGVSLLVAVALASRQGVIKVRKWRADDEPPALAAPAS
jgi:ribose transport system permease protein